MLYVHNEMAAYSLRRGDMAGAWDGYISSIEIAEQLEHRAKKEEQQKKWKNVRSLKMASKGLLLGLKATNATSQEQQNGIVLLLLLPQQSLLSKLIPIHIGVVACLNEKEGMLQSSLELDRETENGVSLALHAGYLGQLYLQTKRNDDARRIFAEASKYLTILPACLG
jgi:tetratricopeptide (TPR) repeat protein